MVPVSVIIPSFNSGRYLIPCVRSINQGGAPDEIIIVDDGSTDESTGVAEQLSHKLPNVRWIRVDVNQGLVAARRRGVLAAGSEWVAHVDADDRLEPGAVRNAYETVCRTGSDICVWQRYKTDAAGMRPHVELDQTDFPMSGREAVRRTLGWWRMHGSGVSRRGLFLDAFDALRETLEGDRFYHADELITRLVLSGAGAIALCEKKYLYCSNPESISRVMNPGRLGILDSRMWQIQYCVDQEFANDDLTRLIETSIGIATWAFRHRARLGSKKTIDKIVKLKSMIDSAMNSRGGLRLRPKYRVGNGLLAALASTQMFRRSPGRRA